MTAKMGGGRDNIVHFTGVRMRITGSGNLKMTFFSEDDIFNQPLVPFTMQATTNIRPTRLANFQHQQAVLEGKTTEINEHFHINRILVYAKDVFTQFPG